MAPRSEPPVVLIDDREKLPLSLPNSRIQRLPTGDYTIENLIDSIAVERKSLSDIYGCIGQSRERFERELERLAKLPFPAIVIESNFADVLAGVPHSEIHPHSAVGSIVTWGTRYRIPVWFAGNRRAAAGITYKILLKAAEEIAKTRV